MSAYQPGQRIALVHTNDPYTRLQPGDTGTVQHHDQQQQDTVYVRWDNGSTLAMCLDAGDRIRALPAAPAAPARGDAPAWDALLAEVRSAAAEAGGSAAEWWAQDTIGGRARGDTRAVARRVLAGIQDGDPAVLDTLPPADPPHQAADVLTGGGWDGPSLTDQQRDTAIDAYRSGFATVVLDRVTELCQLAASPNGRDVSQLHPDQVRIGSAGVFAGDWSVTGGPDGDRIAVGFAGTLIDRWNGWAVFSCTRPVAEAIVTGHQDQRALVRAGLQQQGLPDAELDHRVDTELADLRFDGDVLIADQRVMADDPQAIHRCGPDLDGHYVVMGWNWCWQAVDPYRCDRIVGDLPLPGDQQQFEMLRHTPGLRVPHTRLQLTGVHPHRTGGDSLGAAFTATLTLDGDPVAVVTADGTGPITVNPPDADTTQPAFGCYVAACRHHGQQVTTGRLLQALADEDLIDHAITLADTRGATLLRLIDEAGRTDTMQQLTPIPRDLRELLALGGTLTRQPGRRWQTWTGRGWFTVPVTGPAGQQERQP
ncbi:DUF4314 domain-containing protein [Actinoplanes sp. M2I2]|uniref:DUF4314 domain-containing protein n=1 Tax=Actinoplanes sp. M2I2 TaxID=1734444 RepID=UPI002020425B|nr:DUF4314 domain-containing protein [Actinoplanes sp. M2I2]